MKKLIHSALILAALVSSVGLEVSTALAVGSSTYAATDITERGAILNGAVTHGANDYVYAFVVSTSSDFTDPVFESNGSCPGQNYTMFIRGSVGGFVNAGTTPISFSLNDWGVCSDGTFAMDGSNLVHLKPSRTYYYRAGLMTGSDSCMNQLSCYELGATMSFTTRAAIMPTLTNIAVSDLGPDNVTFTSDVISNDAKSSVTFEYALTRSFENAKSTTSVSIAKGLNLVKVTTPVKGLIESSIYYYRAAATNVYGQVKTEIKTFETKPPVGISINDAADYTKSADVKLMMSWPSDAVSMLISNDGGFRTQKSFQLEDEIDWKLVSSGDERLPKNVYMKFVLSDGSRTAVMSDDIILDTTAPVVTMTSGTAVSSPGGVSVQSLMAKTKNAVKLVVASKDGNSGIATIQVRTTMASKIAEIAVNKSGKVTTSTTLRTTKKTIYVRVIDRAGNPSSGWKLTRVK